MARRALGRAGKRKLSPRAADDYEAAMRGRAIVTARNSRKSKRAAAGDDWVAF